jgi:hypothetical protein
MPNGSPSPGSWLDTLDLGQFTTWCRARSLGLFAVRRADIESFARKLEARRPGPGYRHPATVHHRQVLPVRRGRRTPGSLAGPAAEGALGQEPLA